MKGTTLCFGVIVGCLACTAITAQDYGSDGAAHVGYAVRYGGNGAPLAYRHASTYAEGAQRGTADLVRAWGDYVYSRSLAMINHEEARRRYMENRELATRTYFKMREINREARAAEATPRPTREDIARYAQLRLPERLEAHELDATFGMLSWPSVLRDGDFSNERSRINWLMTERSRANSTPVSSVNREIRELTDQMETKLKAQIAEVSPSDYLAARKFLDSLQYETQQQAQVQGLARR